MALGQRISSTWWTSPSLLGMHDVVEGRRPLHLIFLVEIFSFNYYSDLSPFISISKQENNTFAPIQRLGPDSRPGYRESGFSIVESLEEA